MSCGSGELGAISEGHRQQVCCQFRRKSASDDRTGAVIDHRARLDTCDGRVAINGDVVQEQRELSPDFKTQIFDPARWPDQFDGDRRAIKAFQRDVDFSPGSLMRRRQAEVDVTQFRVLRGNPLALLLLKTKYC